ncbi:hypothetical protein FRB94_012061 [Tulasnella sp. JGI-2019a]|nr:hypothetical protein FRB94_012061 [Tulasnella sp. JGI-2019a]
MPSTFKLGIPGILPDDMWVEVYRYLEIIYIVRSARACRYLNDLIKQKSIWINAISSQIYGQDLRLPGLDLETPIADYHVDDLRDMTTRAIKLSLNLISPTPRPRNKLDIPLQGKSHVTHVFLIHGEEGTNWLLVSTAAKFISCYEVLKHPLDLLPASSWDSREKFVLEVVRDKSALPSACILGVTLKEPREEIYRTLIIRVTDLKAGAIPKFNVIQTVENAESGRPYLIRGDYIVMWRTRRKICTVVNWRTGGRQEFNLLSVDHPMAGPETAEQCCAVELTQTSLIMVTTNFRTTWAFMGSFTDPSSAPILPTFQIQMTGIRSASIVHSSLTSPLLDNLPDKSLSVAAFLILKKEMTKMERTFFELLVQHEGVNSEWKVYPLYPLETVRDRPISPYIQAIVLGSSGRGVVMERARTSGGSDSSISVSRLRIYDIAGHHIGVATAIDSRAFKRESHDSAERDLGPLLSSDTPLKTNCFDYDDAEGRIVVGANGLLRIIEYV